MLHIERLVRLSYIDLITEQAGPRTGLRPAYHRLAALKRNAAVAFLPRPRCITDGSV